MIKKIKINDLLLFPYFLLLFVAMFSNVIFLKSINNGIKYFALLLLFFGILIQMGKIKKRKIPLILGVSILFFISFITCKDYSLLFLVFLLFYMQGIDFNSFIKKDMYFRIIAIILVLLAYKLGLTDNYYALRENGLVRSSMGFSHPNSFGIYIMCICADYIYLKLGKLKLYDYIIFSILIYIISIYSNSRTSQIAILMLLIFCIIINKFKFDFTKSKTAKMFILGLPFLLILISLYLGMNFEYNSKFSSLNKILSGRLSYANYYLNHYSFNLFGNNLLTTSNLINQDKPLILDNSYLTLLLKFGVVSTIIFICIIEKIMIDGFRKENKTLILIMIVLLITSFSENYLFQYQTNVFLLYFATSLNERRQE